MQGHIHKRVHACTDGRQTIRWYVVVDIEPGLDGRRRQKWHGSFRTRREAEVVRARLVNDLHNHRYVIPARLTLGEWVRDSWLPMVQTRPSRPPSVATAASDGAPCAPGYRPSADPEASAPRARCAVRRPEPARSAWGAAQPQHGKQPAPAPPQGPVRRGRWRARHRQRSGSSGSAATVASSESPRCDLAAVRARPFPRNRSRGPVRGDLAARGHDRNAARRDPGTPGRQDVDLPRARLAVRRTLVEVDYRVLESTPKGRAARTIDLDGHTVALLRAHAHAQSQERETWGDGDKRVPRPAGLETP